MRRTKVVELEGVGAVTVKELTVAEIREWLADLERGDVLQEADMVDLALFEELTVPDLQRMTDGLNDSLVGLAAPSQLRQVIDAAKELNADFFGLRARLAALAARGAPQQTPATVAGG